MSKQQLHVERRMNWKRVYLANQDSAATIAALQKEREAIQREIRECGTDYARREELNQQLRENTALLTTL